jgi:pyruvate kinase
MPFPSNKTKIVCTIGPASNSPEILKQMILAGMNIARLNFSHGEFSSHKEVIDNIRSAAEAAGRRVAIMADLSGPKMRISQLEPEPIELKSGDSFTLTNEDIVGNAERVSMSFPRLPQVVKPGDKLFLNDGFIQLEVVSIENIDVQCKVIVGGELRSRKGLNLPGIDLGIRAFTDRDHECLKFAMENGVDAVSQSFVETGADIHAVREATSEMGQHPFIIAKIERHRALILAWKSQSK